MSNNDTADAAEVFSLWGQNAELLLRWCRSEFESTIRLNPGREDEVRDIYRRAVEPFLGQVRSRLSARLIQIDVSEADLAESAKAAELLGALSAKYGGDHEA